MSFVAGGSSVPLPRWTIVEPQPVIVKAGTFGGSDTRKQYRVCLLMWVVPVHPTRSVAAVGSSTDLGFRDQTRQGISVHRDPFVSGAWVPKGYEFVPTVPQRSHNSLSPGLGRSTDLPRPCRRDLLVSLFAVVPEVEMVNSPSGRGVGVRLNKLTVVGSGGFLRRADSHVPR